MEAFERVALALYKRELLELLTSEDPHANYCINVDFLKLFEADPNLGDEILCNPKNVLPKCDEALVEVQKRLSEEETFDYDKIAAVKQNVHARFFGLPVCPELHRVTVPKNKDLGCFLKITGTAIRITQAKMLEYRRNYKCLKCHHIQKVEGKYEYRYVMKAPTKCNNSDVRCRSTTLSPIHDVSRDNCKDYQEMKIQEQVNKLTVGGIPGSIWVTLEDDLVDCCKPGDDISICGIVMRRWCPVSGNKRCEVELVIKANHIEICNTQKSVVVSAAPDVKVDFNEFWLSFENRPLRGRDIILASVCSKVYGLYMIKLALILTVITSCNHSLDVNKVISSKISPTQEKMNESSVRGQCHLLLVGDPGTGKSQLLKAGALLTSRSVLTSGFGSTKAGLTCTALREDGEWQLEAGALVLADGGVCCIDELTQMREHDRASIHEAMEQQTISIAKAGMVCKLNTRCAVIAACNPKGNYDTEQPLNVNVSLGTPLLSRFDLIFILLDCQTKQWDDLVTDYILFGKESHGFNLKSWSLEKLQLYLSLIGPFEVKMTRSATTILQAYYVRQRGSENRDPSRTTVRMLDSLIRLSQAHARLMYRKEVLPMDAITAVNLMDLSMQDCVFTGSSNALQSNFSKYPEFDYLKMAKELLSNLNLFEIWHEELLYFAKLLNTDKRTLNDAIENNIFTLFKQLETINNEVDDEEGIIESTYFKKNNVSNDSCDLNDTVLTHDEDQNVNDCDVSVQSVHIENDLNINKINTELLAKTLKKHSSLNNNAKRTHLGMISVNQNKGRKRKQNQNESSEFNGNDARKNKGKGKGKSKLKRKNDEENIHSKKKPKNVSSNKKSKQSPVVVNEFNGNNDDDDDDCDLDQTKLLNCMPSVYDVFDGLNINFNVSDDESDDLFQNSQPGKTVGDRNENSNHDDSTDMGNKNSEENDANENISIIQNTPQTNKTVNQNAIISSVEKRQNIKSLEKLKKFTFVARSTDKENSICEKILNFSKTAIENDVNGETVSSVNTQKSQSLFEDDVENYDFLDI